MFIFAFNFFILKILLVTAFLALLSNGIFAQQCTATLSGHVEDEDTNERLANATVLLVENGKQLTTDDKGDFTFLALCEGAYTIVITHISCDTLSKKIVLGKNTHLEFWLPHNRKVLGVVTVDAQRGIQNTGFKKELTGRVLDQTKGLSLAEALSKINGVTLLQTGSTIAKPVIHGLHSSRILTINNGVRQEGQQWGNEHAPEIDPFIADKLVVIKGVDELRYGSDAIGGVVLVEPKALRNTPGASGEINTAYFTNNQQYVVSGMFEQQSKKNPSFTFRVQGTYKKGANTSTPNYRLNNTGSDERNASFTAAWKRKNFNAELFYSHFATTLGIFSGSHIGNTTDLQNAIGAEKPNDIFLGQRTYTIGRPKQAVTHDLLKLKTVLYKNKNKFTLLLATQYNNREEFDIVRSRTNKNPQLDLSIFTVTEEILWELPKKNNFTGTAGLSFLQQDNRYKGRYFIPNYFAFSAGAFYIEKWSKHKWELQAGLRYDNKSINTTRLKFNGDTLNFDFNFSTLASSFNAVYKASKNVRLSTNIGLSSRAPYVNELLSDGIHHGTATFEKGDISLRPERSFHFSAGLEYEHPGNVFGVDILAYSNQIKNFIYQQPRPANPVLTISGAFPLIQYQQTDANLSGLDFSSFIKPIPSVNIATKYSFLSARNKTQNDWLILMPANRLSNEISYNLKDNKKTSNTYISVEMQNVMQQKNIPDERNGKQDYKVPPPAYTLIGMNAATTFMAATKEMTVSIGVRNLLNIAYRDYLNSFRYFTDEMGRNVSIRLKVKL